MSQLLALMLPSLVPGFINWPALNVKFPDTENPPAPRRASHVPIVVSHGMGDGCKSNGLQDLITKVSQYKSTHVSCIGDHGVAMINPGNPFEYYEDIWLGYLGNLNMAVDYFAAKVKENPQLNDGFNAFGFSQGNLIIRGYIQRHNDPPVKNFVSLHGPMLGIGGLPGCDPMGSSLCQTLFKYVSLAAYTHIAQSTVFQADYVRNPTMIDKYLESSYLPDLNNEISDNNEKKRGTQEDYKKRFSSLERLVLVKAGQEEIVLPSESEWFGFYTDGSYGEIQRMEDSPWYQDDSFGLKTLHQADKITFIETEGSHCQVSSDEFRLLMSFL